MGRRQVGCASALLALAAALTAAGAEPRHGTTFAAHSFDRGNLRTSLPGKDYAGAFPCVWNAGAYPNWAEYDLVLPAAAEYAVLVLYTAAQSRPVDILVDGQHVHTGLDGITGDWKTDAAQWEEQCTLVLAAGRHVLRLESAAAIPHICAWRLETAATGVDLAAVRPPGPPFDWRPARPQITIPATEFDRSNLRVSLPGEPYAGGPACIWNAGELPNYADYTLEFPVTAEYVLSVLYTAAEPRPVDIVMDGSVVHAGLKGTTGGWDTRQAAWERQCTLRLAAGSHTLRLERGAAVPHICALRLESSEPFPEGWTLERPGLAERRAREARALARRRAIQALSVIDGAAMRRALADLAASIPTVRAEGPVLEAAVSALAGRVREVRQALESGDDQAVAEVAALQQAHRDLLLRNPALDFDEVLLVRRSARSPALGLPQNWQSNCVLPRRGFDDAIVRVPLRQPGVAGTTLHRPAGGAFVGDVDLSFDARRLLFSSIGSNGRWHVFEIGVDGKGLRQVTPATYADIDDYDPCYLPDGRILFTSTRAFAAVPCVNGSTRVANLFRMNADGSGIRQLCFDQEHNWCPAILHDGSVLYTRWEYTDTPHTHTRLLFRMNPDGTQQMAYYGSNSYWPNAMFYTRPIPGHPTRVVTIVSGHHGVRRMGELVILDPALGRSEADGAVQRIPGFGKPVEARIEDQLVDASWPKFLHPFPLNDKYFLVSCQPSPESLWGVYLVDVFDNLVLLREEPGFVLFEPLPLRETPRPPVIPDRTDGRRNDCVVQLTDIYRGAGLAGVPRGTVKALRVFTYTYDYPGMGGPQGVVGLEGPWDIRRILGTVPVQPDGSASFRLPANTPVSVQPLDARGCALQLMRSWLTGMPGEVVSCVGCHEPSNQTGANVRGLAMRGEPSEITPWRGPARGYAFANEVQPVLDRHCVSCHRGQPGTDAPPVPDLRGTARVHDYDSRYHHGGRDAGHFSVGYATLQRFVRRPGLESDYHLLTPLEFHANTTELVQMLRKGHHGVRLDDESWDRLTTWIDLNAPFHGSWLSIAGEERVREPARRRREMLRQFAGVDVDMEWTGPEPPAVTPHPRPVTAAAAPTPAAVASGWPFAAAEAARRQQATGGPTTRRIALAPGLEMVLVRIPAGDFVMGSNRGDADESPPTRVVVESFWIGQTEVSNEQFAAFDPRHDSRVEVRHAMQFGVQGWPVNTPTQPVVRVSWRRAVEFCQWLGARLGEPVSLPTEAQWEYACRAGSAAAFAFGGPEADYSSFANLADRKVRDAVSHPYHKENLPLPNPSTYDDWIPRDDRFADGMLVSAPVGSFRPNAWGVHDMHGNVWEWTQSAARQYPYSDTDSRNAAGGVEERIVRGGSWRDRPNRARASFRLSYPPWQRVYNVGFRVSMAADAAR